MPGGPPVVGLFGGALVLVALSLVGLDGIGTGDTRPVLIAVGDVVAFGFILGSGVMLVGVGSAIWRRSFGGAGNALATGWAGSRTS